MTRPRMKRRDVGQPSRPRSLSFAAACARAELLDRTPHVERVNRFISVPAPDPETAQQAREAARDDRGGTIDEILVGEAGA